MYNPKDLRELLRSPLMLSLYIPSILFGMGRGMLLPVLPLYARSFDADYSLVGIVLAGGAIGMVIGDLPSGSILRRFGTKRTMIIGIFTIMLASVGLFTAQTIFWVFVYQIIGGLGGALYGIARHDYLARAIALGARGRAIGLLGGAFRLSRFLGPALGAIIAEAYGLRATFLGVAIVFVIVMIIVAYWMEIDKPKQKTDKEVTSHTALLWQTLRDHYKILGIAGTAQILIQMTREGSKTVIPLYGADVLGLDVGPIGYILSIGSAFDALFFYLSGWLMDHHGRKFAIVPSFVLQGIGLAMIPFTLNFAGLALASSVIGFGNAISAGTMMTLGSDLAPPESRSEFLGMWRFMGDSGGAGAPVVVGQVADFMALSASAIVLALISFSAAGLVLFFVPETLQKDPFFEPDESP